MAKPIRTASARALLQIGEAGPATQANRGHIRTWSSHRGQSGTTDCSTVNVATAAAAPDASAARSAATALMPRMCWLRKCAHAVVGQLYQQIVRTRSRRPGGSQQECHAGPVDDEPHEMLV